MYLNIIEKLLNTRDEQQNLFLSQNGGEDMLESMVTGARKEDLLTFRKLINAIGMIWESDYGCGTIFIADVSKIGVVLLSAGHNFATILTENSSQETLLELSNFSTIFGLAAIDGKIPKNGDEKTFEKGRPMNMQLFFEKFCLYGSIRFDGRRKAFKRIKSDDKSDIKLITEFTEDLNKDDDYCAILLDPDIKNYFDELGLDTLECGTGQQLINQPNQCVTIIGHPAHPDWKEYPRRISYGKENKESHGLTKIATTYDSLGGNSGSPVFGQHYKVKGIHVLGGRGRREENYMQKLNDIKKWIDIGRDISEQV